MTTQPVELTPTLTAIKLCEAIRPGVVTCRADDGLRTVAATMLAHGVHAILVEPLAGGNPLILTDLELLRAGLQGLDGRAGAVAREPFTVIPSDVSLDQVVAKMAELYLAHLLAVDPVSGAPFGVISSFDVVNALGGHEPFQKPFSRPTSARAASGPRTLSDARAGDVMHPGVVTCAPDATLWAVARSMADHRIHCVAVAGVGDAGAHAQHFSWGLVDDMSVVLAAHRGAVSLAAATIATTAPPAVNEDDSLQRAAELMVTEQTRHVVVVGPSGVPSGIISTIDVLRTQSGAA